MKIIFIKAPKPRRFVHKNIYYDPDKEEREERELRVKKELGIVEEDEPYQVGIKRGSFRRFRVQGDGMETRDMRGERRAANVRFVVIAVILLLIAIVLYMTSGDFLAL